MQTKTDKSIGFSNWQPLDNVDTALFKGIAILFIVIHNFMHLFPTPKENEFDFDEKRFQELIHIFINDQGNILRALLSFFGHFGVQIFIFLSAYGLTKKFSNQKIRFKPYIQKRISKIYPAFIISIIFWSLAVGWFQNDLGLLGPLKVLYWNIESLLLKIFLVANFIPGEQLSLVGPWWFISFIFQFYLIFPVLLNLHRSFGDCALVFISLAAIFFMILFNGELAGVNLYFLVFAHLPEFCLGIYLAKTDTSDIQFNLAIFFVFLVLYILGNIFQLFWYISHLSFLIVLLYILNYLRPQIRRLEKVKYSFQYLGNLSMSLFLVNGFLREPFISWAKAYDYWLVTIALCFVSFFISLLAAFALDKTERYVMKKVR